MTIFGRVWSWLGSVGAITQGRGVQDSRPAIQAHKNTVDVGIDGALQVSAVYAAVELISDTISSLPLYVYTKALNGIRELARSERLWILLHDRPNSRHTCLEFWAYMVLNFLLRGNAYARLVRDAKGEVIAMWPLAADQVIVTVLDDGAITYEYYTNGRIIVYAADTILHLRDKGNGVIGWSRLEYMRSTLNVAINAQNQTAKTYNSENRRAGVFMIDKTLTELQREQIRKNFKGLTEAGNGDDDLLVLEAGAKFEPLQMTPADVQLLETRRFTVEDIARWFGVPSILLNDLVNRVPYGNNNELMEIFYKLKIRPMLVNFEQALRSRVLTAAQRSRFDVEFGMDALLRASLKDRMEIYAKATQNGIYKRNECRQFENLPPENGGDVLTAQVNLAPLDMLGKTGNMGGNTSNDVISQ